MKIVNLKSNEVAVPSHCCEWGHTDTPRLSEECCSSVKSKFAPDCLWAMSSYLSAVKDITKSQAANYFQVNNLFNKFRYFPFMNCSLWVQKKSILIRYVKKLCCIISANSFWREKWGHSFNSPVITVTMIIPWSPGNIPPVFVVSFACFIPRLQKAAIFSCFNFMHDLTQRSWALYISL